LKYQLVLQWPASSIDDYDALIWFEDALIEGLPDDAEVDGHDAGSGQANIFILTNNPHTIFHLARAILEACDGWADARIAFRDLERDEYTVLWPIDLKKFEVL